MSDTVWVRLSALCGLVFGGLIIAASSVQGTTPTLGRPRVACAVFSCPLTMLPVR